MPLSRVPGVTLISLQKTDGLDQLADLPAGMTVETLGPDFDAGPDAFLDTAAVMMNLDLIISIDTGIAHLAGALGRSVEVAGHWNRLPKKAFDLWPWLIAQEQGVLFELLGVVVAQNVNAVRYRHEKTVPARVVSGNRLAHSRGLDMTKWWRPDAGFLSRISKTAILAAIADGVSSEVARSLDRGSKSDLVVAAERRFNGSAWLPEALRGSPCF